MIGERSRSYLQIEILCSYRKIIHITVIRGMGVHGGVGTVTYSRHDNIEEFLHHCCNVNPVRSPQSKASRNGSKSPPGGCRVLLGHCSCDKDTEKGIGLPSCQIGEFAPCSRQGQTGVPVQGLHSSWEPITTRSVQTSSAWNVKKTGTLTWLVLKLPNPHSPRWAQLACRVNRVCAKSMTRSTTSCL